MTSPDAPADEEQESTSKAPVLSAPSRARLPELSALRLSNWPVSRRLILVIVIAVVMGVVFGGLRIAAANDAATGFARTTQLAVLGEKVTALAQAMEDERDLTAALCAASPGNLCPASGAPGLSPVARSLLADVRRAQAATNADAGRVQPLAAQIGSAFPVNTQHKAAAVSAVIGALDGLRTGVAGQPPQSVIEAYSEALADLFTMNDEIASSRGDAILSDEVRTLGALSRAKDQASQDRAILYDALLQGSFGGANGRQALTTAQALETAYLIAFQSSATSAEESDYLSTVNGEKFDTAQLLDNFLSVVSAPKITPAQALIAAFGDVPIAGQVVSAATAPDLWYSSMTDTIARMRALELRVAGQIVARSQMLQQGARQSGVLTAAVASAVLLLVLILTFVVARSLVNPLRRLQTDALEVATVRLPSRVAELSETREPPEILDVEPISVYSTDEIGKVARAFDQVHWEAVRLAGNEAMLRGNLNAMFISLSRRSVPLIERLTRMIDSLEQNEDDPDRLSNLFSMDHLVTRMRRNSENLLVLAGEEPVRKWSEPVPLTDVARAATSEIEQYSRVMLNIQPGIVVSGQAASDIVHLLAELIENATLFSPRDTAVHVSGQEITSGGVLLEVRDSGVGVSPARLDEMNWRLDNPPMVDVSVSRHMGLFAVSRLAARHGVRVRLRAASPEGLCALVWLPGTLTGRESARPVDPRSRQTAAEYAAAQLRVGGRRNVGRHRLGLRAGDGSPDGPGDDYTDYTDSAVPAGAAAGPAAARSEWFRAKRPSGASSVSAASSARAASVRVSTSGAVISAGAAAGTWSRDADHAGDGWRTAETISGPVRGDRTTAGLPARVPGANLFAGSASAAETWGTVELPVLGTRQPGGQPGRRPAAEPPARPASLPRRTPELARSRLSGFQLGSRQAEGRTPSAGEGS